MAYVDDGVIDRLDRFFERVRRRAEAIPDVEQSILPAELHESYLIFAKEMEAIEEEYLDAKVVINREWNHSEKILEIHERLSQKRYFGETAYHIAKDISIKGMAGFATCRTKDLR